MDFSFMTSVKRILIGYVAFILLTLEAAVLIATPFGALMYWFSYVEAEDWERGVTSCCAIILLGIGGFLWGERVYYNPRLASWIWLPVIIRTNLVRVVWTLHYWLMCFSFLVVLAIVGWACSFSVETDRVLFVVALSIMCLCIPAFYWEAPVERFTQEK